MLQPQCGSCIEWILAWCCWNEKHRPIVVTGKQVGVDCTRSQSEHASHICGKRIWRWHLSNVVCNTWKGTNRCMVHCFLYTQIWYLGRVKFSVMPHVSAPMQKLHHMNPCLIVFERETYLHPNISNLGKKNSTHTSVLSVGHYLESHYKPVDGPLLPKLLSAHEQ